MPLLPRAGKPPPPPHRSPELHLNGDRNQNYTLGESAKQDGALHILTITARRKKVFEINAAATAAAAASLVRM